jgi:hypothetical protein
LQRGDFQLATAYTATPSRSTKAMACMRYRLVLHNFVNVGATPLATPCSHRP